MEVDSGPLPSECFRGSGVVSDDFPSGCLFGDSTVGLVGFFGY